MPIKTLQVPVIVGNGSKQVLVVSELFFKPPCPPIFRIKDIEKEVIITNTKVIPNKVIINGYIDKNINYKVFKHYYKRNVCGPLFHFTTQVPFSACIDITPVEGEEVRLGDTCEILEAFVEGEKDELKWPVYLKPKHHKDDKDCSDNVVYEEETCDIGYGFEEGYHQNIEEHHKHGKKHYNKWYKPPISYRKIIEKDCVKIVCKVTRTEHCTVNCQNPSCGS